MSLHQWYDSLAVRAYPPMQKFGKGAAVGAGIPTSGDEVKKLLARALGTMFGIPEVYDEIGQEMGGTVEAAAHPISTIRGIGTAISENPVGAAGFTMGAMVPWGRKIPGVGKAELKFGGAALAKAKRRIGGRVAAERARVHAGLEGLTLHEQIQTTTKRMQRELRKLGVEPVHKGYTVDYLTDASLQSRGILPEKSATYRAIREEQDKLLQEPGMPGSVPVREGAESQGDWIAGMDNRTLLQVDASRSGTDPVFMKEIARRGLKRDISTELQVLHEGKPGGLPKSMFRTREEMGGEILGRQMPSTSFGFTSKAQQTARVLSMVGPLPAFGKVAAFEGGRWVNTKRGWTKLEGKPLAKDYDWVFERYFDQSPPPQYSGGMLTNESSLMEMGAIPQIREANIERAVEMIESHGNLDAAKARTIVAKRISDRMKQGVATPQEAVWMNIHRMKGFKPGGFKWH